jgi:hypothetical protein
MKIRIISEIKELNSIKDDWDDLYSKADYSTFQSFEFNYYSWLTELSKAKGNQLCVVLLTTNERACAILPLYIDFNKRLRFINDKHADFCDVLSKEKFDFEDVLSEIRKHFKLYSVHFINLTEDSFLHVLYKQKVWKNSILKPFEKYSILNLDKGTFPYNVSHYRSRHKNRINKAFKKNKEKKGVILSHEQYIFPKKEILLLKETMIRLGIRKDNFLTNERLLLVESLYNSGIIILNIMKHKDEISCVNILLKKSSSEFMFWIDLFDDSTMINICSYINFLKTISLQQSVTINFGRGRYFFKESNFDPEFHKLHQILIFSRIWQKIGFLIVFRLSAKLKSIYKKIKR